MNITILVVDDCTTFLEGMNGWLSKIGYNCITALNGQEALDLLEHNYFYLIITGLMMPVMDGLTMIRKIREAGNGVPIIIITGYFLSEKKIEARELGVYDFLPKPFDYQTLERIIRVTILDKRPRTYTKQAPRWEAMRAAIKYLGEQYRGRLAMMDGIPQEELENFCNDEAYKNCWCICVPNKHLCTVGAQRMIGITKDTCMICFDQMVGD